MGHFLSDDFDFKSHSSKYINGFKRNSNAIIEQEKLYLEQFLFDDQIGYDYFDESMIWTDIDLDNLPEDVTLQED